MQNQDETHPVGNVTLEDLCHFIIEGAEERGDETFLSGPVTKPEQLSLGNAIRFFVSLDDDVPARVAELDSATRTAVLKVVTGHLHPALKIGSSFPIYSDDWFGRIHHVLDTAVRWTQTPFISPDAFEWFTPEGVRTWRIAEPGDEIRTDGKIVPGGWDHEHCDICSKRIGSSGDPNGYRNDLGIWVCESCYTRYIQPRDLRFVLDGTKT